MKPEAVLDLIRSAPKRYDTVRASVRYRGEGSTIKMVRERFLHSEAHRRDVGNSPEPSEPGRYSEPDGPFGWRCWIWRIDDHRWRQELELPDGGIDIRCSTGRIRSVGNWEGPPETSEEWTRRVGGLSRKEDPNWLTTDTYWTMYPFDPHGIASLTFELEELDLRVEGITLCAEREAIRLVGVPVEEWKYPPEPLWWGADEYELLVDAERGILLRCTSRLGGRDFDALEIEEVFFDETFGQEVLNTREPLSKRWDA